MDIKVGIDSIEIDRIAKSVTSERFRLRVFGSDELEELQKRGFPPQSAAVCFAAKEALLKATGMGLGVIPLNQIQLLHFSSGQPYVTVSKNACKLLALDSCTVKVSATHTRTVATVIVIIYSPF